MPTDGVCRAGAGILLFFEQILSFLAYMGNTHETGKLDCYRGWIVVVAHNCLKRTELTQ